SSLKRHKSDGYLIPTKELKQLKRTRSHDGNLKDSKSKKPKKATELKKVKNLIIQIDEKQNEKVKGKNSQKRQQMLKNGES
uniref:Ovule protein n=1 Tax=Meloidogyne hapla TaxID=6305 RepID=A0A1I8BJ07_MELHA